MKLNKNCFFILSLCLFLSFSCSSPRGVKKKDKLGRVTRVSYFEGSTVDRIEKIKYYGNSHNPLRKVFYRESGEGLKKVKEINYLFAGNSLARITFSVYMNDRKEDTGMIKYFYMRDKFRRIEYYSYNRDKKKMNIFGLDQYTYVNNVTHSRRIIEYEYNTETDRSMQIKQFVVYYQDGKPLKMKSWIMDKKSKKIIEKNCDDAKSVARSTAGINKEYENRARAEEFLQK